MSSNDTILETDHIDIYPFNPDNIKFYPCCSKTKSDLKNSIDFMIDYKKYIKEQIKNNIGNNKVIKGYKKDLKIARYQLLFLWSEMKRNKILYD